jgi:hypothetical protein
MFSKAVIVLVRLRYTLLSPNTSKTSERSGLSRPDRGGDKSGCPFIADAFRGEKDCTRVKVKRFSTELVDLAIIASEIYFAESPLR